MNVSAWAIRNPLPPVLLFTVLLALGVFGFHKLPITYFPAVEVPTVVVTITDQGSSPQEIETAVTQPLEDALAKLAGIKELASSVSKGRSSTTVEFELGVPVDRATGDVRDAVTTIRAELPDGIDEPIVARLEPESEAVATYAVTDASMTREELSWFVDDVVLRRLHGIAGAGRIERIGGAEREIQILLDADRLAALGVTAFDLTRRLGAMAIDAIGGETRIDGIHRSVSVTGAIFSLDTLSGIDIALANGSGTTLGDLGVVVDGHAEPESFAMLNEREVVGFSVHRARGASDVAVADAVGAAIRNLAREHPNVGFTAVDDGVAYTLGNYEAAMHTLVEGAVLAVVVVFLFLRDWRATALAALALPLAIVPTFWAMHLLGFSLNVISLLGITLVAGILVDDAIVEIENIARHGALGKTSWQAAIDASDEIGMAVVAISATIIAVFVPVGFMGGVIGQYFREFGLTIAIAVFFSLLVARLVTPLLAAHLMRMHPPIVQRAPGRAARAYVWLLRLAVSRRRATLGIAVLVFAASLAAMRGLPTEFLPPEDNGKIQVAVELPPGSTLDDTRATARLIAGKLRSLPDVAQIFAKGGAGVSAGEEARRASLLIVLKAESERELASWAIEPIVSRVLRDVPDIRFELFNTRGERDVSVIVVGRDGAAASAATARIMQELAASPFAIGPASGESGARPELRIRPLPERMADVGVSTTAIAETLRVSTIGAAGRDLPDYREGERRIPIRLRLADKNRDDRDTLALLGIPTSSGALVSLSQVADIDFGEQVARIERLDRQRRIGIGFDTAPGTTPGQGLDALLALSSVQTLPKGVDIVASGDSDTQGEVFSSFATAMVAGVVLVFVILVLLFNGFLTPLTILATLPLSVGGVVVALVATGTPLSFPVVIGILMLMGIVTKNAIMMIDFALERERAGAERVEASVAAGTVRARPIVMTTLAMVAGMVPSALGIGEGGAIRSPMAIAVIGGLVVSTLLSLIVVPALHCVLGESSAAARRLAARVLRQAGSTTVQAPYNPHPARSTTGR